MTGNLLRNESEFYRVNEELELKAQKLMEEVANVMNDRDMGVNKRVAVDSFGTNTKELLLENTLKSRAIFPAQSQKNSQKTANSSSPNSQADKLVSKLDSLPEASRGVGPEGALHILKVKSQLFEQEYQSLSLELKHKNEKVKKSHKRLAEFQEDHEKWRNQADMIQQLYEKQQQQLQNVNKEIQTKNAENTTLLNEVENLRKELKQSCQTTTTNKAKTTRCLEENAKLNAALNKLVAEEKEMRALDLHETAQHQGRINVLQRRKAEILRGINTQIELIENIKTQLSSVQKASTTD